MVAFLYLISRPKLVRVISSYFGDFHVLVWLYEVWLIVFFYPYPFEYNHERERPLVFVCAPNVAVMMKIFKT